MALTIGMSGSVLAQRHGGHYPRGGNNTAEIILGTALVLGVAGAVINSRPPVVIQQPPVIQYQVPHQALQPPYYDASVGVYIYRPPLAYNPRTGQWYQQSDIYIPQDQHYYGCNFYNRQDADACIERNRHYGR